jgi:murein DD-endopeptidase MepM/ murein hydrolase activator NlpD
MAGRRFGRIASGEFRIQPRNVRSQGFTIRVSRGRIRVFQATALLFGAFVGVNLFLAPRVVRTELLRAGPAELASERGRLGEALRRSVASAQALARRLDDLDRRMEGVRLGYQLPIERGPKPPLLAETAPRPGETMIDALMRQSSRLTGDLGRRVGPLEEQLEAAETWERAHPAAASFVPASSPLRGTLWVLTSRYGIRHDPFTRSLNFHAGIDLAAEKGTPVKAPAEGVVTFSGTVSEKLPPDWRRLGRVVVIRHGQRWLSILGHLDATSVAVGQHVGRGEVVGRVGDSGWCASPLLHYGVRVNDGGAWKAVDPWPLLLDEDLVDEGIAPPAPSNGRRLRASDLPAIFVR